MSTALATTRTGIVAPSSAKVLVIAGSERATDIVEALGRNGHDVHECERLEAEVLDGAPFDIVFVDSNQVAEARLLMASAGTPIVAIGGDGQPEDEDETNPTLGVVPRIAGDAAMSLLVDLMIERSYLLQRCEELEVLVAGVRDGSAFVGSSPVMRRLQSALSRAASSDATVLIEGAQGTGKSLAARVIHCKSRRGNRPLVVRNGAELDAETLQNVLDMACASTLLIEDVDKMPTAGQQALVRFLKERPQQNNSDRAPRAIATSSAHLPELVARGSFREDLYYRLHAYPVVVPALRERTEDIQQLAAVLLDQIVGGASARPSGFTPAALVMLESMVWPGNVTQLENVIRRAYLMSGGVEIDSVHLNVGGEVATPQSSSAPQETNTTNESAELSESDIRPFEAEEQRLLSRALRATRGNVRRAAQLLGIGRATLYRKIQQYRLRLQ